MLGTAVAVAADRGLPAGSVVTLECGAGPVPVEIDAERTGGWMRQPLPTWEPWMAADAVLAAPSASRGPTSRHRVEVYDNGVHPPRRGRRRRRPRAGRPCPTTAAWATSPGTTGTVALRRHRSGAAVTRMFMPGGGIVEDPATGSAAGPVGVHLLRHGLVEPGGLLTLTQGAQIQRPSTLHVRVEGLPDAIAGVGVGGTAVIVGELTFRL